MRPRPRPVPRSLTTALLSCAGALLFVAPLAAQKDSTAGHDHHDVAVAGGGKLPAGWAARPDQGGDAKSIKFDPMGPGYHVTLGPATILYREADRAAGPFHTLATFTQTKAPTHPEGYGLFFRGKALTGSGQEYTYFLVRGDGKYLIKQRTGDKTSALQDWTEHAAVNKADTNGKATNKLEIDAKGDPSKVRFLVNGQEVYSTDAKTMDPKGIVGLRVNHNLDVHVDGFAVHQ